MPNLPPTQTQFGSWSQDAAKQAAIPTPVLVGSSTAAIDPHTVNWYVFTRAGVVAATVAAPTPGNAYTSSPLNPGGDDGVSLSFSSGSANAHTVTFTGGTLDTGSAAVTTATFNASKGANFKVRAYAGRWQVLWANGVAFS